MKLLLKILGGIAVLVLALALVSFVFPRQYRVERSAVVKAKPEAVLAQIADLRVWRSWSVWYERDPEIKVSYSEKTSGVGAWSAWESKKEGNGKMTITSVEPTKVVYALEFPDFGMTSTGMMELKPEADGVRVIWSDAGDLGLNPVNRWFGLFLDRMIGPDFDSGLANIKKIVEK